MMGIWDAIKNALSILAYFFNPKLREKREKEGIWNEFKKLENEYRKALAASDPVRSAVLGKRMLDLRKKHRYLNNK